MFIDSTNAYFLTIPVVERGQKNPDTHSVHLFSLPNCGKTQEYTKYFRPA